MDFLGIICNLTNILKTLGAKCILVQSFHFISTYLNINIIEHDSFLYIPQSLSNFNQIYFWKGTLIFLPIKLVFEDLHLLINSLGLGDVCCNTGMSFWVSGSHSFEIHSSRKILTNIAWLREELFNESC